MSKKLSEKQMLFLEYLFNEAEGDLQSAKVMAGYNPTYATSVLIKGIEEEVLEATKSYILYKGPRAVVELAKVLDDPTQLGVQNKITVAKDILDRIGITKTEKIEVTNGIVILPTKKDDDAS